MGTAWILIVVLGLAYGGTDVKFQPFPDAHACALARLHLVAEIKRSGGGHTSGAFCLDEKTGNKLNEDAFSLRD
jgi:hypothetical protein